jgi:dUTP pyrophosphatase
MRHAYEQCQRVFWERNAEYGTQNIAMQGTAGVMGRLQDKLARLHAPDITPRGFVDACDDLSNYAQMLKLLFTGGWPTEDTRIGPERLLVAGETTKFGRPAKAGDVGYDLFALERVVVRPNMFSFVRSGARVKIPDGYWMLILTRSSSWSKRGLLVVPGVIDTGYTGELGVAVTALGTDVIVEVGDRIGQAVFLPSVVFEQIAEVDALPSTERGATGFGSTDR